MKAFRTYSGPLFRAAKPKSDAIVVSFDHVGDGLRSSDGKSLRHFEVAGADGVFHAASARIYGRDAVEVSSPQVADPRDVRYAWLPYPNPAVNLFNSAGLPASPFTTESTEVSFTRRTGALSRTP